jgi:hypothetical protein
MEGKNPEQLTADLDLETGEMESIASGGEETGEPSSMGTGNLGGLFNSDPHKPISNYDGVSLSVEDGSRYVERGIDKLSGWPAILDLGIGTGMILFSKAKGPNKDDETEENEGEKTAEEIEEQLRKEGQA